MCYVLLAKSLRACPSALSHLALQEPGPWHVTASSQETGECQARTLTAAAIPKHMDLSRLQQGAAELFMKSKDYFIFPLPP